MIFRQLLVGFLLKNYNTITFLLSSSNIDFDLENSNMNEGIPVQKIRNHLVGIHLAHINKNKESIEYEGYDCRNITEYKTDILKIQGYYVKKALLDKLESRVIPNIEKIRILKNYEKNSVETPKFQATNVWKNLDW